MSYQLPTLAEINEFVAKTSWVRCRYVDSKSLPKQMHIRGTITRLPMFNAPHPATADVVNRSFHIHFELRPVDLQGAIEWRWVLVTPIDMHC